MKIVIKRKLQIQDLLRDYKIIINDKEVGRIAPGKSITLDAPQEEFTLVAKVDWSTSKALKFNPIGNANELFIHVKNNNGFFFLFMCFILLFRSFFNSYLIEIGIPNNVSKAVVMITLVVYLYRISFLSKSYLKLEIKK